MASVVKKLLPGAAGTAGTGGGDDDFNLVTQLYQFDGSNGAQNNTLLDSSSESHTVTRNADIVQGTFSPFSADEGKWSVLMDGNNEYLEIDSYAGLGFGTGAYTIEMWIWKFQTGQENLYDGRDGGKCGPGH